MFVVGSLSSFNVAYNVVLFPLPVGPCDEDQTVRLVRALMEALALPFIESELLEVERLRVLVQDADDHLLTVDRGHRADAHVDLIAVVQDRERTVLWKPLLGDVHLRDDLQARQ
jgi:hypothetical protein